MAEIQLYCRYGVKCYPINQSPYEWKILTRNKKQRKKMILIFNRCTDCSVLRKCYNNFWTTFDIRPHGCNIEQHLLYACNITVYLVHAYIFFMPLRSSLWNFNLANNFWTVSARALIFHMNIPCDKIFPWVPCDLKLGVWPIFWKPSPF